MQETDKLVDFVTRTNWLILVISVGVSAVFAPYKVFLGVVLGGLLVAVNFHLLNNTLKKMFNPQVVKEKGRAIIGNVLVRYYLRFAISAGIIFVLISKHIVHPLGLIAGLSVVVASIFTATAIELKRIIFKEAV